MSDIDESGEPPPATEFYDISNGLKSKYDVFFEECDNLSNVPNDANVAADVFNIVHDTRIMLGGINSHQQNLITSGKGRTMSSSSIPASHSSNVRIVVSSSWERMCQAHTTEEMGEELYNCILECAPRLSEIFVKSSKVLAVKFGQMLETMVRLFLSDDTNSIFSQLEDLALRHVDYGARTEYVPFFRAALIETLDSLLPEGITSEEELCWSQMWDELSSQLMQRVEINSTYLNAMKESWMRIMWTMQSRNPLDPMGEANMIILSHVYEQDPHLFKLMPKYIARVLKLLVAERTGQGLYSDSSRNMSASNSIADISSAHILGQGDNRTDVEAGDSRSGRSMRFFIGDHSTRFGIAQGDSKKKDRQHDKNIPRISYRLSELLDVVTQTDKSSSRRYDLGLEWLRLPGTVEMTDVPRLVSALELGIQQLLELIDKSVTVNISTGLPCNLYEDSYVAAWGWLRADIDRDTAALIKQIRVRAPTLIHSWDLVTKRVREDEMGILFYDKLFSIAPDIKSLFSRPQTQVGVMFAAVVAILIKAVQDPLELANQLRKIAIAHIKFNVQLSHIPIFGRCLVETVKDILGSDFSPEMHDAWTMLWERVAVKFYNIIQAGTNLVTKAMITGNTEIVQRALEDSPSLDRVEWACKIDLDGDFLSPLYWAIRDGKLAIAQVLLRDVLTIRKDVERMWYGAEILFEAHPDLVNILCFEAPPLLNELFDGLVWRSRHVTEGQRRVVYFVREIWGDPTLPQNQSSMKTPMGSLVELGDSQLFCHPVLEFVLETKWKMFGGLRFLRSQIIRFLVLLLYVLGYGIDYEDPRYDVTGFSFRGVLWTLAAIDFIHIVITATRQTYHKDLRPFYSKDILLPTVICKAMTIVRLFAYVLLAISIPWDDYLKSNELTLSESRNRRILDSITGILLFGQMIEAVVAIPSIASFLHAIIRMSLDLIRFMIVLFLLMVSFGTALTVMLGRDVENYNNIGTSIVTLLKYTLQLTTIDFDEAPQGPLRAVGNTLIVIYVIISVVLLLNLLIGQITTSYEFVVLRVDGLAKLDRAAVIIDVEDAMSLLKRKKFFDAMHFNDAIALDKHDTGLTGGVGVMVPHQLNSKDVLDDRIVRYSGTIGAQQPFPSLMNATQGSTRTTSQKIDFLYQQSLKAAGINSIINKKDGQGSKLGNDRGSLKGSELG